MQDLSGYLEHLAAIAKEIAAEAGTELRRHKKRNTNYLGGDIDRATLALVNAELRGDAKAARLTPYERAQLRELSFWRWVAFEGYEGNDPRAFPWTQRIFMTTCFMNTGWSFAEARKWDLVEIGCGPLGMIEYVPARTRVGYDPLNEHYGALFGKVRTAAITYTSDFDELMRTRTGSFDAGICFNVLDHTTEPRQLFDAFMTLIKPGGRFILQVNTVREGEERPAEHRDLHPSPFTLERIRSWLGEYGPGFQETAATEPSAQNEYFFMAWGERSGR
jgi:SAM-dependent methyltransferase